MNSFFENTRVLVKAQKNVEATENIDKNFKLVFQTTKFVRLYQNYLSRALELLSPQANPSVINHIKEFTPKPVI